MRCMSLCTNLPQAGRPAGRPAAEGGGANEAANNLDFAEHPRKRQRGRLPRHKEQEADDAPVRAQCRVACAST